MPLMKTPMQTTPQRPACTLPKAIQKKKPGRPLLSKNSQARQRKMHFKKKRRATKTGAYGAHKESKLKNEQHDARANCFEFQSRWKLTQDEESDKGQASGVENDLIKNEQQFPSESRSCMPICPQIFPFSIMINIVVITSSWPNKARAPARLCVQERQTERDRERERESDRARPRVKRGRPPPQKKHLERGGGRNIQTGWRCKSNVPCECGTLMARRASKNPTTDFGANKKGS